MSDLEVHKLAISEFGLSTEEDKFIQTMNMAINKIIDMRYGRLPMTEMTKVLAILQMYVDEMTVAYNCDSEFHENVDAMMAAKRSMLARHLVFSKPDMISGITDKDLVAAITDIRREKANVVMALQA